MTDTPMAMQYQYPRIDGVEAVEKYQAGGFHPTHIGDTFDGGRYTVLHKLGYGAFSTVWPARDDAEQRLVSLKILTAETAKPPKEFTLLQYLDRHAKGDPRRANIASHRNYFTFQGPNGTHACCVSRRGGPNMSMVSDSPGEIAGTRRLHACLAQKLGRQLTKAVSFLHDADIVHGDITPRNVLVQLAGIDAWSTDTVYQQLGQPVKDTVLSASGQQPGPSAPAYLVQSPSFSRVDGAYLSSDRVCLIDLGEAFRSQSPPAHGVGTPVSYCAPELALMQTASKASDIWALACTIFEMRSGFQLFESIIGSRVEVLREITRILGLPPPDADLPFGEDLRAHSNVSLETSGESTLLDEMSGESALLDRVRNIGVCDEEFAGESVPGEGYTSLHEPPHDPIPFAEAEQLIDLLQRALLYSPDLRASAQHMTSHPWFNHAYCFRH